MAALFPKIYDIIDGNPHKHVTLRLSEPTRTEGFQQERWDVFTTKPLDPPGALSLLLMSKEPMYELGSHSLRKQLLTEHLMTLHTRAENELVGRRFPRKKIQDLLAGQVSAQSPQSSALLEEVLCELFGVQKIQIHRRKKTLSFFPPDLRLWNTTKPLIFSEEDNCWIFTPVSSFCFADWLLQKETEGWTIQWPTADGKLEELKGFMVQRNIPIEPKMKKDDMAAAIGRRQAIQTLSEIHCEVAK